LPVAAGAVLAVAGLLGGAYLSQRQVGWGHSLSLAFQAPIHGPAPTPRQPVSPTPPPPAAPEHEASAALVPIAPMAPIVPIAPPSIAPPSSAANTVPVATIGSRQRQGDQELRGLISDCDGRGPCDRHTVARADRLVVAAFAQAERSGVPGSSLSEFRKRWDDLRNNGMDSPLILVGNYALLVDDLNRSSRSARPPRSHQSSPDSEP
jgi:hypothetical protein